jgi:hypothetical protein
MSGAFAFFCLRWPCCWRPVPRPAPAWCCCRRRTARRPPWWCAPGPAPAPKPPCPSLTSAPRLRRVPPGAPRLDQADPAKVQAENRALFEMAPPRPQRYTLYFDAGGTVLTAESQKVLEEVLAAALARSGGDMVITGHTDTMGTGPSNDALSAQRAQQVRQMLAGAPVPGRAHRSGRPGRARPGRADGRRGRRAAQPARHHRGSLIVG